MRAFVRVAVDLHDYDPQSDVARLGVPILNPQLLRAIGLDAKFPVNVSLGMMQDKSDRLI